MKSLLLSLLFVAILATAGFQDKAIGQTALRELSPAATQLFNNFASYDAAQLVSAYNALSYKEQAQLIAVLNDAQLTDLYMATAVVRGPAAANSFLATLPSSTQGTVVNAAGDAARNAGPAGVIIGGASVGAIGTAMIATAVASAGGRG